MRVPATRVVLIGFSGSGKTTVARLLAARLGWRALDIDALVEQRLGLTVPEIFLQHGETGFRASERAALLGALDDDRVVIATGGGAVVDPAVWGADQLGHTDTLVVALDVQPETVLRRLTAHQSAAGGAVERPLLATSDPLARIVELKAARQAIYDRADVTLVSDAVAAADLASEIASLVDGSGDAGLPALTLQAPSGTSEILIGAGSASRIGELTCQRWPRAKRAWVVTDTDVGPLHGAAVLDVLGGAGFDARLHEVASGEGSKSLRGTGELYDWMLNGGIERGDVVVALGGGVVGDLAGFVAATCLRGVGLVQVPTSLLAMVDSSVGGKTGVNHRAGKNLIGAFYQPPLVVIDPAFLRTLPPRELTSGWAEIVKHAVIQPSTPGGERGDLLTFLERNAASLQALDEPATSYLIRRNVALKAAVVEADEREAGLRQILNFGHTLGHAIEAAGYAYLHGEAVAVGMRAAARIGAAIGTCDDSTVARVDALLDLYGLPKTADVDAAQVLGLVGSDKKRAAGRQRWVLPVAAGGVCVRDDVPADAVAAALHAVVGPTD